MKRIITAFALAATAAAFTAPAMAEEAIECTRAPVEKWMSKDAAAKMFTGKGYQIRSVKKEDSCLELYAIKDGKKMEIFINPVDGKVIETKVKN